MHFLSQDLKRLLHSPSWNPVARGGAHTSYTSGKSMWVRTKVPQLKPQPPAGPVNDLVRDQPTPSQHAKWPQTHEWTQLMLHRTERNNLSWVLPKLPVHKNLEQINVYVSRAFSVIALQPHQSNKSLRHKGNGTLRWFSMETWRVG